MIPLHINLILLLTVTNDYKVYLNTDEKFPTEENFQGP